MYYFRYALMTLAIISIVGTQSYAAGPSLGTADGFGVLAGSAVTNTGKTVITGDVGVSPGTSITGFPPGTATTLYPGTFVAAQAEADAAVAYNTLALPQPYTDLTGSNLNAQPLTAGVYHFDSSADLTGVLTFDGGGNSNSDFIIQIGSTLTTATGSTVILTNGANADHIFWQIGSSATLGTDSAFAGNILAFTSITLDHGADLNGRALALNGAVTLDTNNITIPKDGVTAVPEPSEMVVMGMGLLSLAGMMIYTRKRRVSQPVC